MGKRNFSRKRRSTDAHISVDVTNANAPLAYVVRVYEGSDGDATKALYDKLSALGPAGIIATNLFRAQKNSARAKVYRGGGYRGMAYDRKKWAMDNLDRALIEHAVTLGITWGWGGDPEQPKHGILLYVDLPTGQVSFHTDTRGTGPDYAREWDGMRGKSVERVCRWCATLLGDTRPPAPRPARQGDIWITVGEDHPSNITGERQVHNFPTLEAAHEAGFTWAV